VKVSGSGQTIVILDQGPHAESVRNVAQATAPGAVVVIKSGLDETAIRAELENIADHPGSVCCVVLPWGLPGWSEEYPPPWTAEAGKGFEPQFKRVRDRGIYIVASAGDDREGTGDRLGAAYPACSPYCTPAMGRAGICYRTDRGIISQYCISSSLAAPELAGAIALLLSAGSVSPQQTIAHSADRLDGFPALNVAAALKTIGAERGPESIDQYKFKPKESGNFKVVVEPPLTITRYKSDGQTIHRRTVGSTTVAAKANEYTSIGISRGVGEYSVRFSRS
jgi:hypothetical protein